MEQIHKIVEDISKESFRTLKEMSKSKNSSERKEHAEILKLLCESTSELMNCTANLMAEMPLDQFEEYDD